MVPFSLRIAQQQDFADFTIYCDIYGCASVKKKCFIRISYGLFGLFNTISTLTFDIALWHITKMIVGNLLLFTCLVYT